MSNVNHPQHYRQGAFECIDVMVEVYGVETVKSFCLLNTFKYLWRCNSKNGDEDVEKAQWYLDKYLDLVAEQQKEDEVNAAMERR